MQFLEREKKLYLNRKEDEIKHLTKLFEKVGFLFLENHDGFSIAPINRSKFALKSNRGLLIFALLTFFLSIMLIFSSTSIVYFLITFLLFFTLSSIAFWRIIELFTFEVALTETGFTFRIGKNKFELKRKVIIETYLDEVDNDTITRSTRCWDFKVEKNVVTDSKQLNLFTLSEIGNGEYFLVRNFCFYLILCSNIELEFKERK